MIGFIVHKQSHTATVRENCSSYSLTDDGGIELRNNLNDCLSVKLCDEF